MGKLNLPERDNANFAADQSRGVLSDAMESSSHAATVSTDSDAELFLRIPQVVSLGTRFTSSKRTTLSRTSFSRMFVLLSTSRACPSSNSTRTCLAACFLTASLHLRSLFYAVLAACQLAASPVRSCSTSKTLIQHKVSLI